MPRTLHSNYHYSDQIFKRLSVEKLAVEGSEFHDCNFENCSLAESIWRRCRFSNCIFKDCNLNLIQVPDCVYSAVLFEDTSLMGVNWTQADWGATRLAKPFDFLRCNLNHATFIGLRLTDVRFEVCSVADVDFREAVLVEANFNDSDLNQSLFHHTDLTRADLSRAKSYSISPTQNILKDAQFSLPEALSLLTALEIILVQD